MSDIKDLPMTAKMDWQEPDLPEGRALNADVLPFVEFLAMHQRIGGRNSLKPKTNFSPEALENLRETDDVMKAIDDDYMFTSFSMEPESIQFFKEVIKMFKPQVILELGAGLSTLILSKTQNDVVGDDAKYVTLEQNQDHMNEINKLAERAHVDKFFDSHVIDIIRYAVGDEGDQAADKAIPCFDLDEKMLHDALGGVKPDMIIIDGPMDEKTLAGTSFAKTLTLPVLSLYVSEKAVYFMTNCYQDTEIFAMSQWHASGAANVIGIKAAGDGLMVALAPIRVEGHA